MGIIKNLKLYRKTVLFLILFFFVLFLLSRGFIFGHKEMEYGVTFSHKQASNLGLPWREVYLAMLDDLGVKKLRLSAYWDELEQERGVWNWDYLDWQISEAEKRNVEIVLAVGGRLPRWPECHFPEWSKASSTSERQIDTLQYIRKTIERYRDRGAIRYWQIENEPFLPHFGECPDLDVKFLDEEIALVKTLDSREVMMTDSGELSLWVPAAKRADIFGTTMYLDTYSAKLKSYIHYPIEPGFFQFKKNISKLFASPKDWIVIELQAEPWGPVPFQQLEKKDRDRTMDLEKFKKITEFARQAGFKKLYLWGVEWWYWEKKINNDPKIWEEAKNLYHKK